MGCCVDKKEKLLGELLLELNIISPERLEEALAEQHKTGKMLGEVLLRKKFIEKKVLGGILEYKLDIPYVNLLEYDIDKDIVTLFPREFIKQHNSIPVKKEDNMLFVAMASPLDSGIIEKLRIKSGMEIVPLLTTPADIDEAVNFYFDSNSAGQTEAHIEQPAAAHPEPQPELHPEPHPEPGIETEGMTASKQALAEASTGTAGGAENASVVKLVSSLIKEGADLNASDLHLEAGAGDMRVRMRVDGILYDKMTIPKNVQHSVIACIKSMAGLNTS